MSMCVCKVPRCELRREYMCARPQGVSDDAGFSCLLFFFFLFPPSFQDKGPCYYRDKGGIPAMWQYS